MYQLRLAGGPDAQRSKSVLRSAVPSELTLGLTLASESTTVDVVGHTADLLERDPTAHTDIDQSLIARMVPVSMAPATRPDDSWPGRWPTTSNPAQDPSTAWSPT